MSHDSGTHNFRFRYNGHNEEGDMPTILKIIIAALVFVFSSYMAFVYGKEHNIFFMCVAIGFAVFNLGYAIYQATFMK